LRLRRRPDAVEEVCAEQVRLANRGIPRAKGTRRV
jgi:hypothetical protein